jgi:hypothetical protein
MLKFKDQISDLFTMFSIQIRIHSLINRPIKCVESQPEVSTLSNSLFPLLQLWSLWHPWSTSFHFSFLILRHSVGLLGRGINPSQGRYLQKTQNKRRQTSIPWVVFEHTIPVFERVNTGHALDRGATVIGEVSTLLNAKVCHSIRAWASSIHFQSSNLFYKEMYNIHLRFRYYVVWMETGFI